MDRSDFIYLKVADFIIQIEFQPSYLKSVRPEFKKYFYKSYKGFILPEASYKNVDFSITVQDIPGIDLLEHQVHGKTNKYIRLYQCWGSQAITYYYINLTQFRVILREILQKLLTEHHGFQIHSSAVIVDGQAVLFVGKHTAGKSTSAHMARKEFPILADDSIAVRYVDNQFFAYHTFDYEKNYVPKHVTRFPIKAVNFLYKSPRNQIKKIEDKGTIAKHLMKEIWLIDKNLLSKQSSSILRFIHSNTFFNKLYFSKKPKKFRELLRNHFGDD